MPQQFDCTDSGNSERIAYISEGRLKYVPEWGRFMIWTGRYWKEDNGNLEASRVVKAAIEAIKEDGNRASPGPTQDMYLRWYIKSRSRERRDAAIALLRSETSVAASTEDFDKNPYLLQLLNGTVDLRSGELSPHKPENLSTKLVKFRYDPKAVCPEWDKFLSFALPSADVRGFLQRYIGYCLTGLVGERMFVVLYGRGRNGKSVLLRTLQTMLGPYAISAAQGLLMSRDREPHPTELADLYGVRLVVASEVRKGRTFDEEQVKRLTGDDRLKARRMREDFWEFDPTHKLILAANHRPRVADATDSFWDRVALIPFNVRIPDAKINISLRETLSKELPGIFNWAMKGCLEWQKHGLGVPSEVRAAVQEYRDGEDRVGQFVAEQLVFDPAKKLTNAELTAAIKKWCEDRGARPFSDRDLADRLAEGGASRNRTSTTRGWVGVGFRRNADSSSVTREGTVPESPIDGLS